MARNDRSREVNAREILTEAGREPEDHVGLFTALLDRFSALGGVELDLPGREKTATRNVADFDGNGIEIIDSWLASPDRSGWHQTLT